MGHPHEQHSHLHHQPAMPAEPGYPEHPEQHPAHAPGQHPDHVAHDKHAGHSVAMFRRKFWLSLVLTVPTLVWGHMLQRAFGYSAPLFPGSAWIPPVFGTAVFVYGGWVFIQGAVRELRDRLPGMMTLISLAMSVAFVFSAAVTLGYPGMPLWEELATLVTIMLLGHWIEMRSIQQAQGALRELAKLLPDTAVRIIGDRTEEVPVSDLRDGDFVLIRPGAGIPADGVVRQGESSVNESMITGESRPVHKAEGQKVIAGTVNGSASLRVEVTGTGERTALAGIMRLVAQAQRFAISRPGAGRPRRVRPHIRRTRSRGHNDHRVAVAAGDPGVRGRTPGYRAGHRMPARIRVGNSTGHCDLDNACSTQRFAGSRPARTGRRAPYQRRRVR